MKPSVLAAVALLFAVVSSPATGQKKLADIPSAIPYGRKLEPQQDEPIFAVCSKQGMRILVSRDDGRTWTQTFLGTDALEDGGWHGTFAVYGMASTNGVIGVFSGWGSPGVYIGSDDGVHWGHLNATPTKLGSVWGAAAGNGVFLTSADQWRGMSTSMPPYTEWTAHTIRELLDGGKTHHMICGFGDYDGGRFVIVGDNHHVFTSADNGQTWHHSLIPPEAGKDGRGQETIVFGNKVFLCSYNNGVARSEDGGVTWSFHDPGLKPSRRSWRALSFVNGEFWLTNHQGKHGRMSRDGINWEDLPTTTPGGRFVQGESGTIINVERGRYDIQRSEDGIVWKSVFTAPKEDVSWDTTFAVYDKVRAATK